LTFKKNTKTSRGLDGDCDPRLLCVGAVRWIVANELTILSGSIGVIMHSYNYPADGQGCVKPES